MAEKGIYTDIAQRTNGDIYVGVVGPVRTGKSTFIKRFMEALVLPNIKGEYDKERTRDELPQSSAGKTVMTTEPKFIPDDAVEISIDDGVNLKVKMIDCVGFIVPEAIGHIENGQMRMVHTPWNDEPVPFDIAAETGTKKVITDHCTIGMLVTCDGTFGELGRENYVSAEERTVSELKAMNRPFVIILNSAAPDSQKSIQLAMELEQRYCAPVALINCLELDADDIKQILKLVLLEFPVCEVAINVPEYLTSLSDTHPVYRSVSSDIIALATEVERIKDITAVFKRIEDNEYVSAVDIDNIDLGCGRAELSLKLNDGLFYTVLSDETGFDISDDGELISLLKELSESKKKFDKVSTAYDQVMATGYGIVSPDVQDLTLEEPVIVKQPGGYGVRLRASAPSVHMIRANIETEVNPTVGTEQQSEDLVKYLLREFEEAPSKIWDTNMFGKSLYELVNEGLNAKLSHIPDDARMRLCETLEKIINEGSGGLICIIL